MRWRQSGADAVYLQPYVPMAQTLNNQYRRVGSGVQLDGTWQVNRYLDFQAEVLRQEAGPAITAAGGHAVKFAMLIARLRF